MRHQSHGPLAMNLLRRQFLHLAAGAAALPALSRMSWAQTYPSRPVRLLIGFSAGGGADIVGRLIGQWLQERLGQPVVIENRPGAGTNVATEALVRAPADGYTLGLIGLPNAINATLYDKLSFNFIRDVTPVAGILRTPEIMVVNLSVPATSRVGNGGCPGPTPHAELKRPARKSQSISPASRTSGWQRLMISFNGGRNRSS
jgi:Tripartite tricarboxylate transporter family receptor